MLYRDEPDGLAILDFDESEKQKMKVLLSDFARTDSQAPQMADQLQNDLQRCKLNGGTLKQFSKWCHTGVRYLRAQQEAREISCALFGRIIPRLCDQQNKMAIIHIEQLKVFLLRLKEEGRIAGELVI